MNDFQPPENIREFLKNPHFARYYHTWQENERSLVFIPLAEFFRAKGLLVEALAICKKGLAFYPQSVTGRLALTRIYLDLDRKDEATSLLEGVLQEVPGQGEAVDLLKKIHLVKRLGGQEAVQPSEEAPISLSTWDTCTMAEIYAGQGEYRRALVILDKIIAADAGNDRARHLKEEVLKCKSSSSTAQT